MSDEYQYIDVNAEEWEGTPRALREALDKAQKALKAEKQATAELRTSQANTALSGVLTGFKNPERVKSAILSDKVDPLSSEAVTKWLEENGDDYAKAEANPAPVQTEQQSQAQQSQLQGDPLANIRNIEQIATPIGSDKWDSVKGQITADMDGDAVKKLLFSNGI